MRELPQKEFGEITHSWNPITGCLHNCVTGDTMVLTADLIWKPIKDIEVGERIVGFTEGELHGYRILVEAIVLNKYRRRKRKTVYLIRGESSSVKSTDDHLWLVKRGGGGDEGKHILFRRTRHVARYGYPIKLLGDPVEKPLFSIDYMKGYIAGIFCGDSSLHYYRGKRSCFARLAIKSIGVVNRFVKFLSRLGICHLKILTSKFGETTLFKIESWSRNFYEGIVNCINESVARTDYMKGFLAGIYDAEGSYSSRTLRISGHDKSLRRRIIEYGMRLGFHFREEEGSVRLTGGLIERIRFFATTFPAAREKKKIFGETMKFALDEDVDVEKYGEEFVYDISTTSGTFIANGFLAHNCSYCWARDYAKRLAAMGVKPYKTHVFKPAFAEWRLKQNFPKGSFVFVSDMGDMWGDWVPREWIKRVLNVVKSKFKSKFFFLTKNPRRYLEFEREFSSNVMLGVTLETNRDYKLSRAPPPRERYEAMVRLNWENKAIVIEPILDFDEEFIEWIYEIKPKIVYVGYDNYSKKLPEPKMAKTQILLEALNGITDLRPKTIRKAWYE